MEKKKIRKQLVIFVCTGNTCRSPVAERLFRRELKKQNLLNEYRVLSIGLAANIGDPLSEGSRAVLKENKISTAGHKSKQLTTRLIKQNPVYICMTATHKQSLVSILQLLGQDPKSCEIHTIAEIVGSGDVLDPYMGDIEVYQKMFAHLEYATLEVLKFIRKS